MTKIEWTDATWNPITGCSKVSAGCKNCYAERFAKRMAGRLGYPVENPFAVTLHPDRLDKPLNWRKPRRIFVNSMSDLFHPDVPDAFIDRVFAWMGVANWHTFQVLTKRPKRMASYLSASATPIRVLGRMNFLGRARITSWPALGHNEWPLPNVWLGTSVENQRAADERIPLLLQTPAAVRWISAEPLLGPVNLSRFKPFDGECFCQYRSDGCKPQEALGCPETAIDWVVVGGESGPGARPMHPDWARSLRDQCKAAGVPFLFKQHGEWRKATQADWDNPKTKVREYFGRHYVRVGKKAAGRLLDGVLHDEYPEVRA